MDQGDAVGIFVPAEYLQVFKTLIAVGLEKAKIPPADRRNMFAWWDAEKDLLDTEERKV